MYYYVNVHKSPILLPFHTTQINYEMKLTVNAPPFDYKVAS